jgi:hypothetical protein
MDSQSTGKDVQSFITEEVGANTLDHLALVICVNKSLHTQGYLPTKTFYTSVNIISIVQNKQEHLHDMPA